MQLKWPSVRELIRSSKREVGIIEIFVKNGAEKISNGEILTNPPPIELIRFFNLKPDVDKSDWPILRSDQRFVKMFLAKSLPHVTITSVTQANPNGLEYDIKFVSHDRCCVIRYTRSNDIHNSISFGESEAWIWGGLAVAVWMDWSDCAWGKEEGTIV